MVNQGPWVLNRGSWIEDCASPANRRQVEREFGLAGRNDQPGTGFRAIGLRFQRDRAFGRGCRCTGGENEGGEIVRMKIRACQVVPADIPMCRGAGR